jgi:hypothetical protein
MLLLQSLLATTLVMLLAITAEEVRHAWRAAHRHL